MSRSLYALLHRRFGPKPSGSERHRRSLRKREKLRAQAPFLERLGAGPTALGGEAPESVVVVGAGFSGLNAAVTLTAMGVNEVTLLEASPRVGGRVKSDRDFVAGRVIEAGAELIGANHPMWLELARSLGLGLSVITSDDQYSAAGLDVPFFIGGELLTEKSAEMLYKEMDQVMDWISIDADAVDDPYAPWESLGAPLFDRMSVADRFREWGIEKNPRLWEAMRIQQGNDNVADLDQQSYLGLLALVKGGSFEEDLKAYWTETEVYRCEDGNDALSTGLATRLGVQRILKNCSVTGIEIQDDEVNVTYLYGQVEQRSVKADYVILATPSNTWGGITFSPELSLAQYQMSTGNAIKYLCKMDKRFWIHKEPAYAPSGSSSQLGMTWEGTDNQMLVGDQGIEMSIFAGGPYVLPEASYTESEVKQRMEQFHPGFSQHFVEGRLIYWPGDPFIRTGYSCPAPGQVCTVGQNLNQPFAGRLFFAGEQTCMAYFGYMEGALQAGSTAAERVLAAAKESAASASVSQSGAGASATPAADSAEPQGGTVKVLHLTGDHVLIVRVVGGNTLSLDIAATPSAEQTSVTSATDDNSG